MASTTRRWSRVHGASVALAIGAASATAGAQLKGYDSRTPSGRERRGGHASVPARRRLEGVLLRQRLRHPRRERHQLRADPRLRAEHPADDERRRAANDGAPRRSGDRQRRSRRSPRTPSTARPGTATPSSTRRRRLRRERPRARLVSGHVRVQLRHREPRRRRPQRAGRPDGGRSGVQIGPTGATYNTARLDRRAFSTIALHGKVRVHARRKGHRVAAVVQVGVPVSGAPQNLGADPGAWFWPQVIAEKRFGATGRFKIGAERRLPRAHGHERAVRHRPVRAEPAEGRRVRVRQPRHRCSVGFASARSTRSISSARRTARTSSTATPPRAQKLSEEVVGGIKLFVERNSYFMIGAGPRAWSTGLRGGGRPRFVLGLRLRAVDRRPRRGRLQGRRGQVPRRTRGLRRLQGRGRLPRSRQRQRRHPRRQRPLPERPGGPRRRRGRGRLPRRPPTAIATATASSTRTTSAPTIRRIATASRTRTAAPIPTTTRTASPTSDDQCPNDPEDKDGFEDEDGCPDPDNDHDQHPGREGQVPERSGDLQRLRGRGRLPRQGQGHHRGQRHPHSGQGAVPDGQRRRSCRSRSRSSTPSPRRSSITRSSRHRGGRARRRALERRVQPPAHPGPRRAPSWRRCVQRGGRAEPPRLAGLRRVLPGRSGSQPGGLGQEPPRRVQGRQDRGRTLRASSAAAPPLEPRASSPPSCNRSPIRWPSVRSTCGSKTGSFHFPRRACLSTIAVFSSPRACTRSRRSPRALRGFLQSTPRACVARRGSSDSKRGFRNYRAGSASSPS